MTTRSNIHIYNLTEDSNYSSTIERVIRVTASADEGGAGDNHQEHIAPKENVSSQNVTFLEEAATYSLDIDSAPDATYGDSGATDCGLGGFLERYVALDSFKWEIGTDLLRVIDPWSVWRNTQTIKDKLNRYTYLKCDLEVRIMINGTGFHYGQLMVAYAPMLSYTGRDFQTAATAATYKNVSTLYNFRHYAKASGLVQKEVTDSYFSTYPHVLVTPGPNLSMEMQLPFMWYDNYMTLTWAGQGYSDGTTGMQTPGSLVITDLVGLNRSTDTASNTVDVTMWVRAVNVDLNTPTIVTAASEVQRGGFISGLATGVAGVAAKAAVIPGIKPYAKATELAATSIGAVAQLFGFSKPTDPTPAQVMSTNNAKNIAVTNVSDNSQKLAFDIHQEVTVDSRVIGASGADEMCFAAINQKWWWCGKAPWTPSATTGTAGSFGFLAATPTLLYRSLVTPTMWRRFQTDHTVSKEAWQLNPAGYVANTFNFWRGSVTYRIQVVASKFHTGRLKIQFDPRSTDATQDVETRYTWILDLSEANEIEVTIPYTAYRSYLSRRALAALALQDPEYSNSTTATIAHSATHDMGALIITAVNDLVAPNGVNGKVFLSVWARMGHDMEYQVPGAEWHDNILKATGSSDVVPDDDDLVGAGTSAVDMWPTSPCPDRTAVWFGERVLSIRSLVKRFSYQNTLVKKLTSNGQAHVMFTVPHWPAVSETDWGLKNTYAAYFTPCYLAKRGGMRYKTYFWAGGETSGSSPGPTSVPGVVYADRMYSTSYVGYTETETNMDVVGVANFDSAVPGGYSGGLIAGKGLGNELIEVESPYYQSLRYQLAQFYDNANSTIDVGNNYLRFGTVFSGMNAAYVIKLSILSAAAEDFSLMFFLAAPVLYEN